MVGLVLARKGRELQRYNSHGGRIVVGCVPYRFKMDKACGNDIEQSIEVLVISSQKGHGMMFPKGGWEMDESILEAASREALEEAGVQGHVEDALGTYMYRSRSNGALYEGHMFAMRVAGELLQWPEMSARVRRWVSVADMMDGCEHWWMKEALSELGGWEIDETITQAALREAMEESGVQGHLEGVLGKWMYKSRSYGTFYEGIMFPLKMTEELLHWPEMNARKRRWVSVAEAREGCQHLWMREALERLVARLSSEICPEATLHDITFTPATEQPLVCLCA